MDRNRILYKVRRKIQALAFNIIPSETLSKVYYQIYLHERPNIDNPKSLNEKLQWYKLRYCPNNPLVVYCSDKYQVRTFVEEKGYASILTNLIGVWENAKDIDWNMLPQKFVLKCTHGCAYNILCIDKNYFNKEKATKQLNKWLKEDFSKFNIELHYGKIKNRRIICEEYLGDIIVDYKFFCFNGVPHFFYVFSDLVNDRQAKMGFFSIDGNKLSLIRDDYKDIGNISMPLCLNDMIETAKALSEDFPFVRVDFFLFKESFRFAELTFTPSAAMMPINPRKYNIEWGELLMIPPQSIS